MRRFGRATAFVLVFVMVFALFAALGMYGGEAGKMLMAEGSVSGNYLIVEIVPTDNVKHMQGIVASGGFGDTSTIVKTYTPATINTNHAEFVDDVAKADLFVINQDGHTNDEDSFYHTGNSLAWKDVFLIFKRIAGVNGTPARYIIDESVYNNSHSTDDGGKIAIPYANKLPNNITSVWDNGKNAISGKTANVAKLYMMLEVMDPGNFYGIYFANQDDTYGIDPGSGKIKGYKFVNNTTYDKFNAGFLFDTWNTDILKPRFLVNSSDSPSWSSDIGYKTSIEISSGNDNYDSSDVNKRGIAFKLGEDTFENRFASIKENLQTIISRTININYRNYRILVIEPNQWGSTWNRSIAYKFFKDSYTNSTGKPSLIGGVKVDTISMYNFSGYLGKIEGEYDCIYLGSNNSSTDPANVRDKLYSSLGKSYTMQAYEDVQKDRWWGNSGSTYYPGLDLSNEMKTAIESFANNNLVIVSTGLTNNAGNASNDIGNSNIKDLLNSDGFKSKRMLSNNSSINTSNNIDFAKLKNILDTNSNYNSVISLNVLRHPNIYNSDVAFQYKEMNPGSESNRMEYKVNDSHAVDRFLTDRKLEFEFSLGGASAYTANLIIDTNADGRFTSADRKVLSNISLSPSCEYYNADKGTYTLSYQLSSGFRGALYWKLEVSATNLDPTYITGCSAIKSTGRRTINILQIIPVDSENMNIWKGTINPSQRDNTAASVILPMKSEINAAGGSSKLAEVLGGSISNLDKDNKVVAVQKFFDDKITIQTREHPNGSTLDWDSNDNVKQRHQSLLASAGMFYYFVEKEGEYDINVLRVSTKEFADRLISNDENKKITYNASTGVFSYKNPDPDKTGNVSCDLIMLGFGRSLSAFSITGYASDSVLDEFIKALNDAKLAADTTQKNAFVGAADRILNVIMDVIKGKSLDNSELESAKSALESNKSSYGTVFDTMYTKTVAAYAKAKNTSNTFVANTNYIDPYEALAGYIDKNNPIFVGYGVIKATSKDKTTEILLNRLGMDRYNITQGTKQTGAPGYTYDGSNWSKGDGSSQIMIKSNEGSMTSYPYSIPELIRGANVKDPVYQLDLNKNTNDISVFYTWYAADGGEGVREGIGDVVNQYYMYKKNNITYCGMGHNEASSAFGKTGSCIKLPEAALLVNAIVATQGTDPDGHTVTPSPTPTPIELPNIVPTGNPGSTETTETVQIITPSPSITPSVVPTPITYVKTSVYVYPEYDGTKNMDAGAKPSPMPGNPAITQSTSYSTNTSKTSPENVMKFNFKGDVPGGSSTKGTIKVTAGGKDLQLQVYNSDGTKATGNQISNNGEYYVLIPLDGDFYKGYDLNKSTDTVKYGMDESENFKVVIETIPDPSITQTGGVGKKTDVNIVKRGIFRID